MKSKLKAVGKLQQMEEKQRDRVGQQLDAMR
ncbi:flagellar export protein FliJ, partial [Vibrio parahaemolyticus]|nr:flagellar export protein FliJ [Vibrio parahaemolyticus]